MKHARTRTGELHLDTLSLVLPARFRSRAKSIALQTARQLGETPLQASLALATLNVPALRLGGGESDAVIAKRIARAIHAELGVRASAAGGEGETDVR
jgi:hypothetical protein